jgi:DNA anti-recombination protein RmuC
VPVAIPFDTLDYARKLEVAGVPTAQAELQATALGEALAKAVAASADLAALTTKVEGFRDELTTRVDNLRNELTARIENVHRELTEKIENIRSDLTAKIENVHRELTAKIENLRNEMMAKFESVQTELRLELGGKIDRLAASVDMLKWMLGFIAALNIGILGVLVRLLMLR